MKCIVFLVQVSGPVPGSARSAAVAATALVKELRTRGGVDATPAGRGAGGPGGSKAADGGSLAELVVAGLLAGSTMTAFARIAVAFLQRGAARRIVLRDGERSLTVCDPSDDTERAVVDWLAGVRTQSGADSGAA
ncbi:hypothetical protein O7627_26745 [Solwaraspora sp. WMMD1047]|uniref:hypothetical protein n=1 Tax=Solwaraspora sp. WMMD1047 TaxID=3016102 RepID=UPI0024180DB5|nr:hypothetical protein [Solwaraspora sp. WMMD1047]MDG4832877.1 hypothetical protein [Solwaraspora sp. WMMD1047]